MYCNLTKTITEEEVSTGTGEGSTLILFNDDFNTFEWVIKCLVSYCKHTPEQAEQCAWIVHNNGKCVVKKGDKEELLPINQALLDSGLSSKVV